MKHGATRAKKAQAATSSILIIGYGNPLRRDDGAGPLVATKLARYWAKVGIPARLITDIQLMPEMAEDIASNDVQQVVFVDSGVNIAPFAYHISRVEVDAASPALGHHLEPETLLVYAAMLYQRYPRAWLVTVPGEDFTLGSGFSAGVDHLLHEIAALGELLLSEMKERVPCMS
jgi:hydrogenase maturation protease